MIGGLSELLELSELLQLAEVLEVFIMAVLEAQEVPEGAVL